MQSYAPPMRRTGDVVVAPAAVLVVALAAVLFGACGSSGADHSATTAPSTSTTSVPAPTTVPDGRRSVLMIGDSLTFDGYDAFAAALGGGGTDAFIDARPGTGLLVAGPIPFDWGPRLDVLLADHRPDDVVFEFVGNYAVPLARDTSGREIAPNSPAMYAAWRAAMNDWIGRALATGASVYWVLPPPTAMGDPALDDRFAALRRIYATEIPARWPQVHLVDWAPALTTPDGRYASKLPGANGTLEQVRDDDGLHLTLAGARRAAAATARALGIG